MQEEVVKLTLSGIEILHNPLYNKGSGFTQQERDELGLNGLIPPRISTVEDQIQRTYFNFCRKHNPLEKYQALVGLMSRNELLFYQFLARYPAEMLPIIYTPTVGEAAVEYSRIYFHQRGLYLSYPLKDRLEQMVENSPRQDVDVIVVTDGERILGLGDLGIGGMTIPIGKLSLYTLFGGIHPAKTLPIVLDVGTNNEALLNDPFYLGWRHKRLTGFEYDKFIDRFIQAIRKKFPNVLLQWEDFGKANARRILDTYRKELLSFNDDIQGTAAVTLAGLLAALKVAKQKFSDQRIAILGGGSAGTGIADMIVTALIAEGMSQAEACDRIYIIDIDGLIHFNTKEVNENQAPYVKSHEKLKGWKVESEYISLLDVCVNAHPTILIGVCAQAGVFTKQIVEELCQHTKRPILFPLSNPTSKAECTAEQAVQWSRGQAIIATGSPFHPVSYEGKTYAIGQCNNVYIFPGIGLGALASQATEVTDGMFLEAAETLSKFSPALKDSNASLYPSIEQVRNVSRQIALAVALRACKENVARVVPSEIEKAIEERMWQPNYPRYTRSI